MERGGSDDPVTRPVFWAATQEDVDERRAHARRLEGSRLSAVRYVNLDFRRNERHPHLVGTGPRVIEDPNEWMDLGWRYDGFDSIDYGFELSTGDGRVFAVTWDLPGWHESIGLQEGHLIGMFVRSDLDVATWDVSRTSRWAPLVGGCVTRVELRYRPWSDDEGGFWCPHISIGIADVEVEVILAEVDQGMLVPSANNVAVLFPPSVPPSWHSLT